MGSLDTKSSQMPSNLESEHATISCANELGGYFSAAVDKGDLLAFEPVKTTAGYANELRLHSPTAVDKGCLLAFERVEATASHADELRVHSPTANDKGDLLAFEPVATTASHADELRVHSPTVADKGDLLAFEPVETTAGHANELRVHSPTAGDKGDLLAFKPVETTASHANELRIHSPTVNDKGDLPAFEHVETTASHANELRVHSPTADDKGDLLAFEPVETNASHANELRVHSPTATDKGDPLAFEPMETTASHANELKVLSATPFDKEKSLLSFTSCSSSISSPDSTLEDPFLESDNELENSFLMLNEEEKLETQQNSEKAKEESSDSEIPISTPELADFDLACETPPTQVMERPSTPKYRIPSAVFSRKKSVAPVDWSIASNESLFSIQMGGMSFCNQDSMLWKSGELGYGTEPSTPGPIFNFSSEIQFVGGKAMETGKNLELDNMGKAQEAGRSHELGNTGKTHKENEASKIQKAGEAGNAGRSHEWGEGFETDKNHGLDTTINSHDMRMADEPEASVLRDSREEQGSKKSISEGRFSHYSEESGGSTKSFAFPILAGDTDKSHSARIGGSLKGIPEKPKPDPEPEPDTKPEPKSAKAKAGFRIGTPAVAWTKWFPCFRWCPFCS